MRFFLPCTLLLSCELCACGQEGGTSCRDHADCDPVVVLAGDCQHARCVEGRCLAVDREAGAACELEQAGPCVGGACDGHGTCRSEPLPDGTACDDGIESTLEDACLGGRCRGRNEVDCPPPPACDATPPDPGPADGWRHTSSSIAAALGTPYHRGRDLLLAAGDAQWALAKFAYGLALDKDIHDEDVDLWLLRDCSSWEYLGRSRSTEDGQHETVEGVEDTGGRVYFQIPPERRLGPGRHRIHFVLRGDLSSTDQVIQVLEPDARVAVSDVDGTLTSDEYAQAWDVLLDVSPEAHPHAADAMWALARKGYLLFYLTARPEFLGQRTRDWLAERGFPPGIAHTTLSHTGAIGSAAVDFKLIELSALEVELGRVPDFGFGNKASDAQAYSAAGLDAQRCYYYELDGDARGGVIHDDYGALAEGFGALPSSCLE
ncbi:MAG: phosphatidylinositol transfer protein [Deltaproteobacteria bacterium]|nr:phosphatidylinositol transfer protein [Deltaproteobacteria bacterium]